MAFPKPRQSLVPKSKYPFVKRWRSIAGAPVLYTFHIAEGCSVMLNVEQTRALGALVQEVLQEDK